MKSSFFGTFEKVQQRHCCQSNLEFHQLKVVYFKVLSRTHDLRRWLHSFSLECTYFKVKCNEKQNMNHIYEN